MTEGKTFQLQDLIAELKKEGGYFFNFLKLRNLEAGIIVLRPGEQDTQEPHRADELYYVIEGSGLIELGKGRHRVKKGSIIFVPAGMRHRFYGNMENLIALYMFAE
jgi:mannose-6-phosphate isomerase-like protein (cupin superfamily)